VWGLTISHNLVKSILSSALEKLNNRGDKMKKIEKAKEVRKRILGGERDFMFWEIEGDLDLRGITIKGNLNFGGTTIKGFLDFSGAVIEGFLNFSGAIIEGFLDLSGVTIRSFLNLITANIGGCLDIGEATIGGDLNLSGAIIEGFLDLSGVTFEDQPCTSCLNLERVTIKSGLDLSFKKEPNKIFVSQDLAQIVHWAAPTVPLVVF